MSSVSRTFVFYEPGDGPRPILRVRRCPPENVRLGVAEGLVHVEVEPAVLAGAVAMGGLSQARLFDPETGALVEKPAPVDTRTDDELRADALTKIDRDAAVERRELVDVNDDIHAAKLAEARWVVLLASLSDLRSSASLGGMAVDSPLLDAEAAAAGIPVATLAATVIAKNRVAAEELAAIEVKRQAAQAAVKDAADARQIEVINRRKTDA